MVKVSNRRGKEKMKPNIVRDHNNSMSGIDWSDQMLSYHSGLRKTLIWYKKAGVHILEMFLTNALYLYRKFSPNKEITHVVISVKLSSRNWLGTEKKSKRQSQWLISTIQQQFQKTSKRRNQLDAADIVQPTKSVVNRAINVAMCWPTSPLCWHVLQVVPWVIRKNKWQRAIRKRKQFVNKVMSHFWRISTQFQAKKFFFPSLF